MVSVWWVNSTNSVFGLGALDNWVISWKLDTQNYWYLWNPVKYCLVVLAAFLSWLFFGKKPPRGSKRQRSSFSAIINKRFRYGVIGKKPKRDRKQQQKSKLDRRLRSICTKLDESIVNARIRMAEGDDKIADFTVDNWPTSDVALKVKHPQRDACSVPDPTDIDCFSTSGCFVHKALMSFPNGSSAGLDGISPQLLKKLTAKLNGQTDFSQSLNKSCECDSRWKSNFGTSAVLIWCEINCAKKPDGGLLSIVVGNTFRQLSAKWARYHDFESRQARYGNRQVGVGTKRGAELASQVFRCLIESPQPNEKVILNIDFGNAFNKKLR